MPSSPLMKALGLNFSPNPLDLPPGSLTQASNVVIRRENVIESRRGNRVYDSGFGDTADRAKQLATYKNRILVHYGSTLAFDSGETTDAGLAELSDFAGSYSEAQTGLRIKGIESNGNLYFTTSEGIKKISASTASELSTDSGYITQAGGVKAVDFTATPVYSLGNLQGIMPQDSAAAYRHVWVTEDANNNLIAGTPSQRVEVYNSLLLLMLQDLIKVLGGLDDINQSGSLVTDGNYVSTLKLPLNSTATEIYTNLLALTAKLDQDILYADDNTTPGAAPLTISSIALSGGICTITFSTSNVLDYFEVGDNISISGVTNATALNAIHTLTTVTTTTIAFVSVATVSTSFPSAVGPPGTDIAPGAGTITTSVVHGLSSGSPVTFTTTGTLPAGLSLATTYYVIAAGLTTTAFRVSATVGGAAIVPTTVGTGTHTVTSATATALVTGTEIESNNFRSITQPDAPSEPATNGDLVDLQSYLQDIIDELQNQLTGVISALLLADYIDDLATTTTANNQLTITIPEAINSNYFLQVYRTAVTSATSTQVLSLDVAPGDEMQLVYEAYPTAAEILASEMTFTDITPDSFRGANLYTNAATGEGILQSNDVPPFAKDINRFKNVIFYSNTRTKHKKNVSLLGVASLVTLDASGDPQYVNGIPKLTIANGDGTFNTYSFIIGEYQETDITTTNGAALSGTYFLINSANNDTLYYVWFNTGASVDPAVSGRTGIEVTIDAGDADTVVATKLANALARYPAVFETSVLGAVVTVTNYDPGYTDSASAGTSGFTIPSPIVSGTGERVTQEVALVQTVADVAGNLAGKYFTLNTAFDQDQYYVWYRVSGAGSNPAVAGRTGIVVDITTGDTADTVASVTSVALDAVGSGLKFVTSGATNQLIVTNYGYGPAQAVGAGNSGFTVSTTQEGKLDVLLSAIVSPSQAVDETARSLVRVINKNKTENVYAYYLSGSEDVPGKMLLEARDLNTSAFYLLTNNAATGASFNPDMSSVLTITGISAAAATVVTTSAAHGLINQDYVVISGSNSVPSIDGYHQITYINTTSFSIDVTVTTLGTSGACSESTDTVVTENDDKPNRIYYSKLNQPEAVPLLNYFDVGATDKAILRIFPLRDTLFILKEDGLFRISGESSPFTLSLFDSSCILMAPDSVAVSNNTIYAWTTQGISSISESGVGNPPVSRPIDTEILKVSSAAYTNFKTATWGIGYDSDNSYTVHTVKNPSDTKATIAYRYSNLTNSWTIFDISKTCGVINFSDDTLYMGAGDINSTEKERKDFARSDYADRSYDLSLSVGDYAGTRIRLSSVVNVRAGDVLVQEQTLTPYTYNMLLKKLDIDPGMGDHDYEADLEVAAGADLRSSLVDLAAKLDDDSGVIGTTYESSIESKTGTITAISPADPTVITDAGHGLLTGRMITISSSNSVPSVNGIVQVTVLDANTFSIDKAVITPGTTGTWITMDDDFRDMKACYNKIITLLNADLGPAFANYAPITGTTTVEAIVEDVNTTTKYVTVNLALGFIVGEITNYKAIQTKVTYAPNTFQNPLSFKHFRELTVMFLNKAFTNAIVRVGTDLLPQLIDIPFDGDGNGIFGYAEFGNQFFGGGSHPVPFRTYIPRQCQRCRYIVLQFEHQVAREQYGITGMTLTGDEYSTRAYR